MADEVIADEPAVPEWPLRPWLLAVLLGFGGLLIHLLTHEQDDVPWRVAAAAFVFFGALGAAFTVERDRWKEPAAFAVVTGLVMAGLAWRAVTYGDRLPDEAYGFASGCVATALALPLFQAGFLKTRLRTPYSEIYHHIWTDAISAAGALAFTGLSWIALAILSQLFQLLKFDFLKDLMDEGWFGWTFSAIAFGAALGVLRNELKVLGMLRTVVLLVLSLLAAPLAVGLVFFLLATAISGPGVLWEATRNATPTLLACAAGAFVLTCVIARQDDAAMTRNRVMRLAALALAVVILPLAVFAAVSLGLRLNQCGLAPERLWGMVAVIVACVWGAGYWAALITGRRAGWARKLREANLLLAVGTCALALFLALPILDFGRISAANQIHRLESGKVSPENFDFAALRWDFGDAGRNALAKLAKGKGETADYAQVALKQTQRPYDEGWARKNRRVEDYDLTVQSKDPQLRRLTLDYLRQKPWDCIKRCVAIEIGKSEDGRSQVAIVDSRDFSVVTLPYLSSKDEVSSVDVAAAKATAPEVQLSGNSKVEVRTVQKRYIFVDGKPLDRPLD
jgi:hypothetical protein